MTEPINRRAFITGLLGSMTVPTRASAAPWMAAFGGLSDEAQHGFKTLNVNGRFPDELKGTLYRAGAMRFASADGEPYGHWFDGDGGVYGLRITSPTSAEAAIRMVDSVGLQKEMKAGRRIYSGYGSGAPNAPWRILTNQFKNVANTNVIHWDDELWALVESHGPTRMNPETLETIGESNLSGRLRGGFSAHPHQIAGRPELFNMGITFGLQPRLDFYQLTPGKKPIRTKIAKPGTPLVHDFALTEHHAIVFLAPIEIDFAAVFKHDGAVTPGMKWNSSAGTEIVVIPLSDPHKQRRFTVDPFYCWHIGNAFEKGDQLIIDAVVYPNFDSNEALGLIPSGKNNKGGLNGILTRLTIDPSREHVKHTQLMEQHCEFPQVHPARWGKRHDTVVVASFSSKQASLQGIHDQLSLINCITGESTHLSLGQGTFTGEALMIPKANLSKGSWIMAVFLDTTCNRSSLAVIDSEQFSAGPIATAQYHSALPFTFHGHWLPTS